MVTESLKTPPVFDARSPAQIYLSEALSSARWGAAGLGLFTFGLELLANRHHPLGLAVFMTVFMALLGAIGSGWIWAGGWFEEWSGHLPIPGHTAWHLGPTVAGAAAGWVLGMTLGRATLTPVLAIITGGLVGYLVPIRMRWGWLDACDPPSLVDRGVGLSKTRPRLAVACFTEALRRDPSYAKAAYERASLLLETGAFDADIRRAFSAPGWLSLYDLEDAALADLDRTIRLESGFPAAFFRRGCVHRGMLCRVQAPEKAAELRTLAIDDLTEAIRIDPGKAEAYFERGECRPSDDEGELLDYGEAIRLAPESAEYRFGRGRAYQGRGEHDRAIDDFDEAIRLAPGRPWYHTIRADSYRAKGDYGRSEDDLARARSLSAF